MNKYQGLLLTVANQYSISKGVKETENDWKVRLIYSICGMMAYASLWDESEGPISIVHFKKRIQSIFTNYMAMYPELSGSLLCESEQLEDEITQLLIDAGMVYHRPNRIAPSMKREESYKNILFQRGIALDNISCVSGIGFYATQDRVSNSERAKAMFGLEQESLQVLWQTAVSAPSWQPSPLLEQDIEYLRLKPPFSYGYWMYQPDKTGIISILRTGMKGSQLYYLYRYVGATMEVSPLPQWQVEGYQYRALACACLSAYGILPPIEYIEDGALVHVHMNYLLPPRELAFLKLYSWPERMSLPCDFTRKLSAEVFTAIKDILSDEGYEWKGDKV